MARTSYTGAAPTLAANASIGPGDLTFTSTTSAAGYPDGSVAPFVVTLDLGKVTEEKVLCASRAGNAFTVTARGFDGTTAQTHSAATIDLTISAVALQDLVDHVYVTGRDDHTQYYNAARHDAHSHAGVPGIVGSVTAGSGPVTVTGTATAPVVNTTASANSVTPADIKKVAATGALGVLGTSAPADHVHAGLIDTSQDVLAWMNA